MSNGHGWAGSRGRAATNARGIPILAYHGLVQEADERVGWPKAVTRYWVSVAQFTRQIHALVDRGYSAIPLASVVRGGTAVGVAKPIVITFDDGWASDYRYAAPILDRVGWGSEHFVTIDWIGRSGFMSWQDLSALAARGRGVHSHSMAHANLDRLEAPELRRELELSKAILERSLGRRVNFLALPGGTGATPKVEELARSLSYEGICTSRIGLNRPGTNPYRLRRIPVTGNTPTNTLLRWAEGSNLYPVRFHRAVLRGIRGLMGRRLYEYLKEAVLS